MTQEPKHVVVIGAGVIGLQTALTLLRAGYAVSVIAEFWPGDEDGMYTSPWAGAHWRTHASADDTEQCQWDAETYRAWGKILDDEKRSGRVGESGLGLYTSLHYWDTPSPETSNLPTSLWWAPLVSDFQILPASSLPDGVHTGVSFTTFAVNVPRYLGYLLSLVRAHNGVTIPARLPTVAGLEKALAEAKRLVGGREAWAYVNASGIGAKELCGDDTVYALRGQTVLVRGEAKAISTRLGKTANEVRAIIPRPGSGTTIVGVSKEPGVWSTTVSEEMTRSLLEGGRELAPELVDERDGTFGVIGPRVGLRPARRGGARVEAEVLKNGEFVVHEYGHSGAGYQNSIGSASKVLRLVEKSTAGRL